LDDPSPFNFVRYSVDAAQRSTYARIHGVDGWDRVNENIGTLAKLRAEGHKIEMGLAFLITPYNFHEVFDFCVWAEKYKPDFVHLRPAYLDADYIDKEYPGGGAEMKDKIVPSMRDLAAEITKRWKNVFFRIDKFEGFWTPKQYTKCRATPLMAVTSGDGAFLVCQDRGISKDEEYLRWGNYNTQTFEEIWWGEDHRRVIEAIDLKRCPRCVENAYNEIIEHCFINDGMKMDLI
jgi:MoaA/NifB/PqqE/SkfB family radical SAM enzyme